MKINIAKIAGSLFLSAVLVTATGCSVFRDSSEERNSSRKSDSSSETVEASVESSVEAYAPSSVEANPNTVANNSIQTKSLYVTGITDPIALRESDEDNSEVLTQLTLGTELKFLSADSASYYYVMHEATNLKGYVKKDYVTEEKSAVCKREDYFALKDTAVYTTNDSDAKVLEKVSKNKPLYVISKNSGDYWYVNIKDTKTFGYIKCTELSATKVEDNTSKTSSQSTSSKTTSSNTGSSNNNNNKTNNNNNNNASTSYYTGYGNMPSGYSTYYAKVNSGYLAIRSAKAFDSANELGKMYTGDAVYVVDTSTGTYWYCYSPNLGIYGYVNSDYLVTSKPTTAAANNNGYTVWTVVVEKNYLALRNAPAFDGNNEIGKLYTNDVVYVYSNSYVNFTDTYWYVYSPSLGKWGYVNSNYIYS